MKYQISQFNFTKSSITIGILLFFCLAGESFAEKTNDEIFLPFPEVWLPETKAADIDQGKSETLSLTSEKIKKEQIKIEPAKQDASAKPKKKKKDKGIDPTEPPFQRGKALLTRNQKKSAESEFAESYSKEGMKANPARTENSNLFGLDAKNKEGEGLVEKIEDPDAKMKAQFELARSLDRMGSPESEEKAYKEYLKLVTTFPIHPELTPRTHFAIAVLLFRKQEFRPAMHHLVKIIKEFKGSKEFSPAHYYAGRIYESAWRERDLERAKKYYDLYLKESESKDVTPGYDFRTDASERRNLIDTPIGI